jgi:DNA replication and repair protein RecF
MSLTRITLSNVRLYQQQEIEPDLTLNIVYGGNASGKTSLLEAINILGTGRSFRGSQLNPIIRHGTDSLTVIGEVRAQSDCLPTKLAVQVDQEGRRLSIDKQKRSKISELAQHLPLLIISPDSHFQFHQKSRARRAVMDWSLFHVEPTFGDIWNRYQRAIQQRNAALKDSKQRKIMYSWDPEVADLGRKIQEFRSSELEKLSAIFSEIAGHLLDDTSEFGLKLEYGWDCERGLDICLLDDRRRDLERGITHSGPHRNDIQLLVAGNPAEDEASHGQNKLLLIALRLAQIKRLHNATNKNCCLLIDDLPAELDCEHRQKLSLFLSTMQVQTFITTTDRNAISTDSWPSCSLFHVEHGTIKRQ